MTQTTRTRGLVVCAILALALAVLATGPSSAKAQGSDWNVRSWMSGLFGHGGTITVDGKKKPAAEVKLNQLAIPGSHDSTADRMGGFAEECEKPSFFQRNFGKGLTERYARTQHQDLYTQATLGIRSFDIRPYYDGDQLRTCHTLDAGTFTSAFEGGEGLRRFLLEYPKEVAIVNISHYRPRRGDQQSKHDQGIVEMARFLKSNVCGRAMDPSTVSEPGSITLKEMWAQDKDYILVADNDEGLYDKLRSRLGAGKCIYNANQISGGYAGERDKVEYVGGRSSSTNLWWGMYDQVFCGRKIVSCNYGEDGTQSAETVRRATEKVLLDNFRDPHKSLHETSYIWVYGTFAGFGDYEAARFRANLNDSSLIGATDKREIIVDKGFIFDTKVKTGLKPHAEDFIKRLDAVADRKKGVSVGIVNMDAIGRDDTFEEFVRPLLRIDRQLLD